MPSNHVEISTQEIVSNNLLIIDDEVQITQSLQRLFRRKYNVFIANNGKDAYDILLKTDINVIISDQRMPEMTGVQFFTKIKDEFPDAIRLILTAYTDVEEIISAINEGNIFRYIKKPWNPLEIESIVNEAFDKHRLITENNQLIQKLIVAKEKAEEGDKLKTEFLNNISHEIRTPLNAISGFSEIVANLNERSVKLTDYSQRIIANSNKLINKVSDIIEVSQIYSRQCIIYKKQFDFISLIKPVFNSFVSQAQNKSIAYTLNIEPAVDTYTIISDDGKLHKIFLHLIDNAIKNTSNGFVRIEIRIANEMIVASVSDTGSGIPESQKEQIFKPFGQLEKGTNVNSGNGLGLTIAQKYVELLNGSMLLESELEKGTTFNLRIPVQTGTSIQNEPVRIHKKLLDTILIVEDEYDNYLYLKEITQSLCERILYADNGKKAVELCKTKPSIDLVFMDIRMPIMDGYMATKMIKKYLPDLPVIAQTAYAMPNDIEKIFESGFDDYLLKPLSIKSVHEKIRLFT
ncbi:MAG: response regulator [Mariniphaga sp.]